MRTISVARCVISRYASRQACRSSSVRKLDEVFERAPPASFTIRIVELAWGCALHSRYSPSYCFCLTPTSPPFLYVVHEQVKSWQSEQRK